MATKKCKAKKARLSDAAQTNGRVLGTKDIEAISDRLNSAGLALLAIRKLAMAESDDDGFYAVAIQELARTTVKGIDACIQRLTGGAGMGNFRTEFD